MYNWIELKSQEDINSFMDSINNFHDSCLKEIKYTSGAYVTENLSMQPFSNQRMLSMVVQRQFSNPKVIELEFGELSYLKLVPIEYGELGFIGDISSVTMLFKDGYIYWCDDGTLTENDIDDYQGIVVCAKSVRWREADEYIGSEEVYIRR